MSGVACVTSIGAVAPWGQSLRAATACERVVREGRAMQIRRARPGEHAELSALALAAKAHWGYDPRDLERWRGDLTLTADAICRQPTWVAELDGRIAGFAQLGDTPEGIELDHFWVHPDCMGRGVGRALLGHTRVTAARLGHAQLLIDADPNAEGFYLACGALRTGARRAPTVDAPERVRPQLVLATSRP